MSDNIDWFTLRIEFAAMAMQGLCANSVPGSHHIPKNLANEAVQYADALIAKLKEEHDYDKSGN